MEAETVITRPGLALGARERVFLAGVRVQEHGEILADRLVTQRQHVFWRRTDHHVVAIEVRAAQQLVAYRASDQVHAVIALRHRVSPASGAPVRTGVRANTRPMPPATSPQNAAA